MDRVQLLDNRQRRGFVLADQRAFGHQGAANAPGNRCGHGGIAQVQPGTLDGGLVGGHFGVGLAQGGAGVVVLLAADGVAFDQLAVALFLQARLERIGLGLAQVGLGTVQVGLERRRVNTEQHVALLDVVAFVEHPLHDHPGDPGAYFGDTRCGDAPAQFAGN